VTEGLILGETPVVIDAAAAEEDAGAMRDAESPPSLSPTLTGESLSAEQGGDGGTPYIDLCPGSQVVIGYRGFLTGPSVGLILVGGIQTLCGELSLSGSSITTTPGATLPVRGTSEASPWTQTCAANQIVVGFTGRSGIALDQVAFQCAAWSASGDGGEALSSGSVVTLLAAGGGGGSPYANTCPAGQVARGNNLRAGEWVDAFGLVCGALALGPDDGGD
jgi:hypothetical protein